MSNNSPKILKNIAVAIFIITLIGYAIYNSRIFITGPQIAILEPQNGSTIENSPLIRVKGTAHNIAFIHLNDRSINVDENSYFDEPVLLYPGYNIITVTAKDKFERTVEKKVELIYNSTENEFDMNVAEQVVATTSTSTVNSTSSLEEI